MKFGLFRSNNRMVIFSKKEKKFISQKACKRSYIHDIHMEEGWGRGSWNLSRVCRFVLFLNIYYSILQVRGFFCWSFFVDVTNVWPLKSLKLQTIQLLEAVISPSTSSQILISTVNIQPTTPSQLPLFSNPLMTKLKELLLPVGI